MSTTKSNHTDKEVSAVQLMREIRDKLSTDYRANPEQEDQELAAIRNKYRIRETTEA
ncbi:MAG: hypothetical protein K9N46_10560 [Candidatus Marinimicrobia bacterium]|nr:hypothetical protein [Candidatus Neomarinimicrobiota bacterium]MCF7829179.1 hypothetical protein [Candidatus Neomarinimicrobiota bacterium]MCF7881168.1 hypothetical protein [Candidatus Neomarinimicrobiota bacterium]